MLASEIIARIDQRLTVLRLSERRACDLAGLSKSAIGNVRVAARNGLHYDPRSGTVEALAAVLHTSAQWLMWRRGPEVVMPDEDTQAKVAEAVARGRKRKGDVNIHVEKIEADGAATTNILGQGSPDAMSGASGNPLPLALSGEALGELLKAIASVHRTLKRKTPAPVEIGCLLAKYYPVLARCESPEEYPHAVSIIKLRLRKELETEAVA